MAKFYSPTETAKLIKMSPAQVNKYCLNGKIKGLQRMNNGAYLIPDEWVQEYLAKKRAYLTITETAKLAKVSRAMVYKLLTSGKLKGLKQKRGKSMYTWHVPVDEAKRYAEKHLISQ